MRCPWQPVRAGAVEWTGRPNGRVTHRLTTATTHRPESLRARSLSPRLPFTRAPDGGDGLDAARDQVAAPPSNPSCGNGQRQWRIAGGNQMGNDSVVGQARSITAGLQYKTVGKNTQVTSRVQQREVR
ncbi:unnamed protein product [Staurois parvus]|uniref:Uncharacterized protein n=1 Tax=Staurois parvus TaxID=386267 RepID=A0ABN9FJC1_9NEOB|nr:unnamed protein product [Staurois parvus]